MRSGLGIKTRDACQIVGSEMGTIEYATHDDLNEMDALRRSNQEAVGFIPLSKWEWHIDYRPRTLIVLREHTDMVGYIFWTPGLPVAAIQQLVIRADARRFERGSELVGKAIEAMNHPGRYGVTCRCRMDLEATLFWPAVGFELVRQEQLGRRGPVLRFYRQLKPTLLNLGAYLPERFRGGGQRQGFRLTKSI